jgi:hypothetical protein
VKTATAFFLLTLIALSSALSQGTSTPRRWSEELTAIETAFDEASKSLLQRLDDRHFSSAYDLAHADFKRKVSRKRFVDSVRAEFLPMLGVHRLVGQELIFTGSMIGDPRSAPGSYYMSSIVSHAMNGKLFYGHFLWSYDRRTEKWEFRNFPFPYSGLPDGVRILGIEGMPE